MISSAVIIANPAAHTVSMSRLKRAQGLLQKRGVDARLLLTAARGDARRLAREAAEGGAESVFAAGGDGTINEVINGLVGTAVPMGILPLGTMNVLARELGIPRKLEGAVEAALTGKPRDVTLGRMTFRGHPHGDTVSRYFCFVAGLGFDGETVSALSPWIKSRRPLLAHILSGIKILYGWNPPELSVTLDGRQYTAYSLIISNISRYSGDFLVAPGADISSPQLHVFLMHGKRRLDILRYALGVLTGRHLTFKDTSSVTAHVVEVGGSCHIQVDGEHVGTSPASVEAVPGALKIIY